MLEVMQRDMPASNERFDEQLHETGIETLERRIMELALERTGTQSGAIFLWDPKAKALAVEFHVVDGVVVNLPGMLLRHRRDGRPNGIALWVFENNRPHLCPDTRTDPHYAPYFLDVRSIAAVPIPYQDRPIGVLSVSAREPASFSDDHVHELEALAASSAKFLRRAQLARAGRQDGGRPFLVKGLSPQWLEVERSIERISATDAPVLVTGESGTGKELVAHAIHFNSARAGRPFVAVNCAAIPETLLESVLFGHVRGAFTGASFTKVGEFRKAEGGTLFLDEVGELPMTLQPKVLRAVEQGEVLPLGSNEAPARVDVRLICATNRDLPGMVRQGRFRDDLYYRIGVVTVELPPLRSYKTNIPVLSQVFLRQAAKTHGKPVQRLSPQALEALAAYDFPGNVRELRNAIEHAVILSAGEDLLPADLPRSMRPSSPSSSVSASPSPPVPGGAAVAREAPPAYGQSPPAPAGPAPRTLAQLRETWLAPAERRYLLELLEQCRGSVREAARRADVNVVTMYRLLKKRGIAVRRAFG
jgi:transcriptional regulator with GAF, ATPase, and Fis domain